MNKNIPSQLLLNRLILYILCCGGGVILIYFINLRMTLNLTPGSEMAVQCKAKNIHRGKELHHQNVTKCTTVRIGHPQVFLDQHCRDSRNISTKNFNNDTRKEWYYQSGTKFPTVSERDPQLFFDGTNGDRIFEQLMYLPKRYLDSPKKIILTYNGIPQWIDPADKFSKCPVNNCLVTNDKNMSMKADAIVYNKGFIHPRILKPAKQVWVIVLQESPRHVKFAKNLNVFNWTATYRYDSDLGAPYGRWVYYDSKVTQKIQTKNYAANKTKQVAWFVSNCRSSNRRLAYAFELARYIQVDIYGRCGLLKCPRSPKSACFDILKRDYKFYLAFENSHCREYITEKYYFNSVQNDVLPIVMGAPLEDYERSVPNNSYIHVNNFATPRDLSNYLHRLDKDDKLYNSYFKWKGTGEFINTYFWCRFCALLHSPFKSQYYEDINKWWHAPGVCQD